jgi:hypothetical protein
MEDLYSGASWYFVFGQASPRERVRVYSFARYDEEVFGLSIMRLEFAGPHHESGLPHRAA